MIAGERFHIYAEDEAVPEGGGRFDFKSDSRAELVRRHRLCPKSISFSSIAPGNTPTSPFSTDEPDVGASVAEILVLFHWNSNETGVAT